MTLYILYNEVSDKYYIGVTENLARRLDEHNGDQSHFTGKMKGEWFITFTKNYEVSTEAYKEEKRLKKAGNRRYLEWYIKNKGR
jgi:putative endonuclease